MCWCKRRLNAIISGQPLPRQHPPEATHCGRCSLSRSCEISLCDVTLCGPGITSEICIEMKNVKKRHTFWGRLWRIIFIWLPAAFLTITLLWVTILKWVPVWVTPLMVQRTVQHWNDSGFHTHKTWVPYCEISPEMARAVIASEDNLFDTHNGFDWKQINKAIEDHEQKGRRLRGASTISQQTAKNVFLLPSRSFVRKGLEAYFTVLIEFIWGKRRIMEVYLNVAEMGKGIYGAEAAAGQLFHKKALKLTRHEACLIAACLPNPLRRNAGNPSQYVLRRASMIENLELKLAYPDWVRHPSGSGGKH